jgi:hypothetical protein
MHIVGLVEQQSFILSFLTCPIKIIRSKNFFVPEVVMFDHISVLGGDFH